MSFDGLLTCDLVTRFSRRVLDISSSLQRSLTIPARHSIANLRQTLLKQRTRANCCTTDETEDLLDMSFAGLRREIATC